MSRPSARDSWFGVILLAVLSVIFCHAAREGFAQSEGVDPDLDSERLEEIVEVFSEEKLVEAFGLVILEPETHPTGVERVEGGDLQGSYSTLAITRPTVHRRPASLRTFGEGRWRVRVKLVREDYAPNSKLTVVARTSSGKTVAGNVQWLGQPGALYEPEETQCRLETTSRRLKMLLMMDRQQLLKMIEIRKRRKEILSDLLNGRLVPELFARLDELEDELGINNLPPLSPRTDHDELAQRIGVIQVLLKSRRKVD